MHIIKNIVIDVVAVTMDTLLDIICRYIGVVTKQIASPFEATLALHTKGTMLAILTLIAAQVLVHCSTEDELSCDRNIFKWQAL